MANISNKDKIRAATVGRNKKLKKIIVEFNGVKIEMRQPTISGLEEIINKSKNDQTDYLLNYVINYAYEPNSDNKIFEEADKESFLNDSPTDSLAAILFKAANDAQFFGIDDVKK